MAPRSAAALTLLLLAPPTADELAPSYAAGDVLVRTFETKLESRLSGLSFVVDGEERSPPELPDVGIDGSERLVVTDEILEVRDGRLVRLKRTYDEILARQELSSPEEDSTRERESPIEGRTVVFTWDEEDGEWSAKAEDGVELDAELLDGLRADLSLSVFLPAGEVEEDDSWDLPASAFAVLFNPAGELSLESDDEAGVDEGIDRRRISADLVDSLAGSITAEYRGTREVDGTEVGVVHLALEVEMEAHTGDEHGTLIRLTREVSGELLWDLRRGRLHALELDGEQSETLSSAMAIETLGGEIRVEQARAFTGTISYRFDTLNK